MEKAKNNIEKRQWMAQKMSTNIAKTETFIAKQIKKIVAEQTIEAGLDNPAENSKTGSLNPEIGLRFLPIAKVFTNEQELKASYDRERNWVTSRPKSQIGAGPSRGGLSLEIPKRQSPGIPKRQSPKDPRRQTPGAKASTISTEINLGLIKFFVKQGKELMLEKRKKMYSPTLKRQAKMSKIDPSLLRIGDYSTIYQPSPKTLSKFHPTEYSSDEGERSLLDNLKTGSPVNSSFIKFEDEFSPPFYQPGEKDVFIPLRAVTPSPIKRGGHRVLRKPRISNANDINEYRSLCKKLKLDKVFKEGKDRVDTMISDASLSSTDQSFNQDLSQVIQSFTQESLYNPTIVNTSLESRRSVKKRASLERKFIRTPVRKLEIKNTE